MTDNDAVVTRISSRRRAAARRILVLAERRYAADPQPTGLVCALIDLGVEFRYRLTPPTGLDRPTPELSGVDSTSPDPASLADDLDWAEAVIVRGGSEELLTAREEAERRGKRVVDPAAAVRAAGDKAALTFALKKARVRVPQTRVGSVPELAETLPPSFFPLILRPVNGDVRLMRFVPDRDALVRTPWKQPLALAQPHLGGDGMDLRLYVVGDRVAVSRRSATIVGGRTRAILPQTQSVTPELAEVARRCGTVSGLTVFAVECGRTAAGIVVGDVIPFPDFDGVPWAAKALARHALGARRGSRIPA